ncbi:hypothetical protein EHF_0217 [Ehrlichia japonica]|uniref:Uncharacterized protein n=1 Tax=Ehrlichia japonica TaxID=391036 RepID=X5H3G4_9RICK|nr:hypothetical protein EHF_0217 [Ehrlichia japonica]
MVLWCKKYFFEKGLTYIYQISEMFYIGCDKCCNYHVIYWKINHLLYQVIERKFFIVYNGI